MTLHFLTKNTSPRYLAYMIKELITEDCYTKDLTKAHYYINRTLLKSINEYIYPKYLNKETELLFKNLDHFFEPYRDIKNRKILEFVNDINFKLSFSLDPKVFARLIRLLFWHSKILDKLEYQELKSKALSPINEYRESRSKTKADINYVLNSHIRKLPEDVDTKELKDLASKLNSKVQESFSFITKLERAFKEQDKHSNEIMAKLIPDYKPQSIDLFESKYFDKVLKPIVNTQTYKEFIYYSKDLIFENKRTNWKKLAKFIMLSKKEFPFLFNSMPEEITELDTTYFQNTYENYNRRQKRPSPFDIDF